ncbi:TonB-dependent receptor [Solimonas marina]|uniref:TonB-dependent receptor n=1 Tax=Solimonas marina TaxID=2714601 RepID=A0A970B6C3_9GAMM|nr:TonB-dependent receptor [Solimonas marina]NKF24307.1 TonB-dependent receptor [Solimonas marina]
MNAKSMIALSGALAFCMSNADAGGVPTELDPMQTVTVLGNLPLQKESRSSTEGYVTAEQLAERPISRAGELLEFVPGLMVTQHSGEGKANQYFLRGFNLDHGTDFYTEVDGLPVNMRTHAHGQGYADVNFIIPELIGSMTYRKGPYYADVGDFAAAGSANLRYVDELPHSIAKVTVGEYGDYSGLLAASPTVFGGKLLLGAQATAYEGPFDLDEDVRKYAGIARYHRGDAQQGFTASLMAYHIDYNAPDQIPQRAVDDGDIGRLGYIDPTDGGNVGRYSANLEWRGKTADGNWRVQGYALKYRMQLYSNFTYFLEDPVHGDQFNQFDDRWVYGVNARRYWLLPTTIPVDITLGLQSRYDDIDPVGLYKTEARQRLSTVRQDRVREGSAGLYLSSTQKWTSWFRSTLGARADGYSFDVDSDLAANSGNDHDAIVSPKAALIFGPWQRTQFFLNYGQGFHSNDARGVTTTVDPSDGVTPQDKVDALVKARGGEFGISSGIVPKMTIAASLWWLNFDSELVYVGDAGANEPSGASRRHGVELSVYYSILPWLVLDADYAYAHARLDSDDGDRIPNSIGTIYGFGITVPETNGWSGGLRLRHLGAGPLIEDNSARSKPTTVVNAQVGYHFLERYSAELQVLNVLDSKDHDITYYYTSRLPGEPAEGVDDYHFHPVEPRAVRLSVGASF